MALVMIVMDKLKIRALSWIYNYPGSVDCYLTISSKDPNDTYGYFKVYGDISTLAKSYFNLMGGTELSSLAYLFYGNKYIYDAENLDISYMVSKTSGCTGMFEYCTSLRKPPINSATTVGNQAFYSAFKGCYNLTTAPMLPATTLANNCYDSMFSGCTSLSAITCLATGHTSGQTLTWVYGVPSGGTFTKSHEVCWDFGINNVPSGWTIQDYPSSDYSYRWYAPSASDYICSGTTKYYREYYQFSSDSGSTWANVCPIQTRIGSVIETNSTDCGYSARTISASTTYCNGCDEYVDVYYQVSTDYGVTWTTTATTPTFVRNNPEYCECVQLKYKSYYSDGNLYKKACDSTSSITSGEITLSNLSDVEIGNCVTSIDQSAFFQCYSLTSVTIGSGVTTIGNSVFQNCYSLNNVSIPNSVTSIGSGAFYACSGLTRIDIPDNVATINDYTFRYGTSLNSCTIGSGVTSIGIYSFEGCSSLRSIEIPKSVTSIGNYAFKGCSGLRSFTINRTTPPTLGTSVFANTNSNLVIYVPAESVNAYKSASGWSSYSSRIQPIPTS